MPWTCNRLGGRNDTLSGAHLTKPRFVRMAHWGTAFLFAVVVGAAYSAFDFTSSTPRLFDRESMFMIHRLTGLLAALISMIWFLARAKVIVCSARKSLWGMFASVWHLLLLALMIVTALLAWTARGSGERFGEMFSVFPKFNLVSRAADGPVHIILAWHKTLAWCLIVSVVIHVLAALVHAVIMRDGLLSSMIGRRLRR